ncbi:MAG: hypothetical protein U0T78_02695 [Cloacibacterium normanense]
MILSFYQRKEIKDLVAYLRLLVNENDAKLCLESSIILLVEIRRKPLKIN